MSAARIAFAIGLILVANLFLSPGPVGAQEKQPAAPEPLTVEKISALAQKVTDSADLDDETKKRAAELLQRANESVEKTRQLVEQTNAFQSAAKTAPTRANERKAEIDRLRSTPPMSVDESLSLAELEQQLSQLETEITKQKQSIGETDAEIANRTARRKSIRTRLAEIERELEQLQLQLIQPPPDGEPAPLTEARRMEMQANAERLRAESPALAAELAAYDAEDAVDALQLRRDESGLQLEIGQKVLVGLQELVQSRRVIEANKQITAAAEAAESETNPLLRSIAQRNVELAERFKVLTEQIAKIEEQLTSAKATRDYWNRTAKGAKEKVNAIGLTDAIGAMLRQQKLSLPNSNRYQSNIDDRTQTIGDVQLQLLDLEDERSRRRDPIATTDTEGTIERRAAELAAKESEQLSMLVRNQRTYFDKLVELSSTEQEIINETNDYRNFIDERILWVRSGPPLYQAILPDRESLWFLDREQWEDTTTAIRSDMVNNTISYLVVAIVFFVLVLSGRRFRTEIRSLGAAAENFSCTSLSPTIRAMSYTILVSLPWPMLFAFLAWRLSLFPNDNPIVQSIGQGFSSVAGVYLPLEFVRQVCQPKGLGHSHFNWSEKSVAIMRRSLRSFMLIGLPLCLVIAMLYSDGLRQGRDTLSRSLFIAAMIALSVFAGRVLHPQRGIFNAYLARRPSGWASRTQGVWYWLVVTAPLLLGAISFFGFAYTAYQLAWRFHATVVLFATLAIATAFLTRALLVHRRHLNIETAQQRRLVRQESGEQNMEIVDIPTAEELRSQIAQSLSLLRTLMVGIALIGIWMTWVDVLPALGFLEQRPIWRSIKTVSEMETDKAGGVRFVTHDVVDNVTVADLAFAVIVAIGTVIGAKNIPGLLEIAVLKRLPIEPSVRYAIETVVSYIIVMIGMIIALSAIGVHWNQIQWMAAALTFGLAFGLQEMFANFVAGIIILVERPIRVGDIVTIDDVTGTVSRVQIRATTITNWDRKDYLVPNKDFITGRVLNWTLSNRFNRIVIPFGVAYGSDKEETVRQVLRVAIEHPLVVDDPAPTVTFEEFADSSLNYVLRCFISLDEMAARMQIVHDLHTAIDDAFRKAGIQIPFPQQDIHLRSVDPQAKLG